MMKTGESGREGAVMKKAGNYVVKRHGLRLFFIAIAFVAYLSEGMMPSVFFQVFPCDYGIASWYSEADPGIQRLTASGEIFDDEKATCASWYFPLGTYVKVTSVEDGKSVICRVNDRGPEESLNRVIDLTKSSFGEIANPDVGLIKVMITPLQMN